MVQWRGVVGLLVALAVFSPVALAQEDTEPPVLVDFDFNPKSVDVTTGPANLTCTIAATDDFAGVMAVQCYFYSPNRTDGAVCGAITPSAGELNGVWTCDATVQQFAEDGVWIVDKVTVQDYGNNYVEYYTATLANMGFPTELDVTSVEDTVFPQLTDFDFNPKSVDVTTGPANLTCTIAATDDFAGVMAVQCYFYSPNRTDGAVCGAITPSAGELNGVWTCDATVQQSAEDGVWIVDKVTVQDYGNNYVEYYTATLANMGFPTELDVTSVEDTVFPQLTDFDFNPKSIDVTTGPANLTCTIAATDDVSGVQYVSCAFDSPRRTDAAYCGISTPSSGDVRNGVWTCNAVVQQYVEEGAWTVREVVVNDAGHNSVTYDTAALASMGFPTDLGVDFIEGQPYATLSAPPDGKRVRGNSVTVRARLTQGNPAEVSPTLGVRFDARALPFGEFAPIPARNPNHPNPDTSYPYFIHWDVSGVPDGDYELRAVAHDLTGTPDPAPETITITIDHGGPADVEEFVNIDGCQENQTAVDSASENKIASGDHTEASTATELSLPAGSLTFTTDTAKLVYPDPANEVGQLEQEEQSIGAFVDLSLLSGQTDLEAGSTGDLNVSYSDADQDGVVDGTNIREEDLELRYLDTGTNSYVVIPAIVLTEHNMVHSDTTFLGKFALAGPLQPRIAFVTKDTIEWGAVSAAISYNVYRGNLVDLVDSDDDGLPDLGYGDCMTHLDTDPSDTVFPDSEMPVGGGAYFYFVTYFDGSVEAGMGNTGGGIRRTVLAPCP